MAKNQRIFKGETAQMRLYDKPIDGVALTFSFQLVDCGRGWAEISDIKVTLVETEVVSHTHVYKLVEFESTESSEM